MFIIFFMTGIIILFLNYLKYKKTLTPLMFYVFFWLFWVLVSLSDPYGLYEVSTNTYVLIWISIIGFSLGFLIIDSLPKRKGIKTHVNTTRMEVSPRSKDLMFRFLDSKRLLILQIIVFGTLLFYLQRYNSLLSSMSIDDARVIVFEFGLLFRNPVETIYYNFIIKSLVHISVILFLINFIVYGRKNISFILSLINVLLFGLVGNGRMIFFIVLIYAILILGLRYLLNPNARKISLKQVTFYVLGSISIIFIMNYITVIRLGENDGFIDVLINNSMRSFVVYFVGGFRALDLFLSSGLHEAVGPLFGRATLSGIDAFIHRALHTLYPYTLYESANSLLSFTSDQIIIGDNTRFNAFYTGIFNYYVDFKTAGVLFFSAIFGAVLSLIYKSCLNKPNLFGFALLIFITQIALSSIYRLDFEQEYTWISIFILIYLAKRKQFKFYKVTP